MFIDFRVLAHVSRESAVGNILAIDLHYSTVNREQKWIRSILSNR